MVKKKQPSAREDRLASALRANLKRRKQAARRPAGDDGKPKPAAPPEHD
ncbi:MAG: hypothetical protein AAFQ22_15645 [Pseudomonadota bacterium]